MYFLDGFTLSTLQENGEICCPNCGSWTYFDDLRYDNLTEEVYCSLCKK